MMRLAMGGRAGERMAVVEVLDMSFSSLEAKNSGDPMGLVLVLCVCV